MQIRYNVKVSDEAQDHLLKHYMEPDANHPSQLRFIPTFDYVLPYKDGSGNVIKDAVVGHILVKRRYDNLVDEIVSPFDNGKKFFAIVFQEQFDEEATYNIEFFFGITYILKE